MSDAAIQNSLLQSTQNVADAKTANAAGALKKAAPNKADEAAKEFEAVFISQMLTHMFAGIETDGMFGGGHAEDIYRGMMVEEYGKIIAQSGGIGMADALKAQLIEAQSNQVNGSGL